MDKAIRMMVILSTVCLSSCTTAIIMRLYGYVVDIVYIYWSLGCGFLCVGVMVVLILIDLKPTKYEREVNKTLTKL